MARPFFVTGLPRSRTAWMAAFLTTGAAICHHEPIGQISDLEDLKRLYDDPVYRFVGVSDSSLGFHMPWILENIAPRTLIIDRPREECEDSLAELGLPATNFCELLADALDEAADHPLVMRVPFSMLSDRRVMQKMFWHLMPGHDFDEVRFKAFCRYNITVPFEDMRRIAIQRKPFIDELMKDVFHRIKPREANHEILEATG